MSATRNGSRQPGDIQSREGARLAAARVAKRLIDGIGAFEQAGAATRFAQLTEVRYWADVLAALAAYDRMFERNP